MQNPHLFVYGTLRATPESGSHGLLAGRATFVGVGTIVADLYDLGSYPGAILDSDSARTGGEIYRLDPRFSDELLAELDEYEGCGSGDPIPHLYRRALVPVETGAGASILAWVYLLNYLPKSAAPIPEGVYRPFSEVAAR